MAVSEDGSPDSPAPEMIAGQPGVSLSPNPAQPGATKRHAFRDQERWLLDMESRAVDWVKATTAGTFWSRLNAVDFMNSSMQFAVLAVLCLFPFVFFRFRRERR